MTREESAQLRELRKRNRLLEQENDGYRFIADELAQRGFTASEAPNFDPPPTGASCVLTG